MDPQPCAALIQLPQGRHIAEIQLRIYSLGVHIQSHGDDIQVTRPFSVTEKSSLHPLGAGQHSQLTRRYAGSPVIVGMDADNSPVPGREDDE